MAVPSASQTIALLTKDEQAPHVKDVNGNEAPAETTATELAHGVARAINAQTDTTYTFVLGDAGKIVTFTNGSGITATVPPNSSVAFPIGTEIVLYAGGTGQVTVAAGDGVTVSTNAAFDLKLDAQHSVGVLRKLATNTWVLSGDLDAAAA